MPRAPAAAWRAQRRDRRPRAAATAPDCRSARPPTSAAHRTARSPQAQPLVGQLPWEVEAPNQPHHRQTCLMRPRCCHHHQIAHSLAACRFVARSDAPDPQLHMHTGVDQGALKIDARCRRHRLTRCRGLVAFRPGGGAEKKASSPGAPVPKRALTSDIAQKRSAARGGQRTSNPHLAPSRTRRQRRRRRARTRRRRAARAPNAPRVWPPAAEGSAAPHQTSLFFPARAPCPS